MAYIAPVIEVVMPVRQLGGLRPMSRRQFVSVRLCREVCEASDAFWLIERFRRRRVVSWAARLQ